LARLEGEQISGAIYVYLIISATLRFLTLGLGNRVCRCLQCKDPMETR